MGVLRGLTTTRSSTRNCNVTRVSKEGTESGIRRGRGRREAVTAKVKVAGVSTSNIKAQELDGIWHNSLLSQCLCIDMF
jgi:hypothetical protein